jgi:hypothetical protein
MTINRAIDRGLVSAEPTNDVTMPFAFVQMDVPVLPPTNRYLDPQEDVDSSVNFILSRVL